MRALCASCGAAEHVVQLLFKRAVGRPELLGLLALAAALAAEPPEPKQKKPKQEPPA